MDITDDNTKYIIPLDGIDLNYITKVPSGDSQLPLWSRNNNNNYYELKVFAQRKFPDNDSNILINDNHLTSSPTYHCNICNLKVPIVYKKEHINSPKHKTCLKIIETAMDRVKLCITQPEDDSKYVKSLNTYFCEACATEIELKKKKEHELSKDHFKSKTSDVLLNDLLKIYLEKEHLDSIDFSYMTSENDTRIGHSESENDDDDSYTDISESDDNAPEELNKFMNLVEYLNDVDTTKKEDENSNVTTNKEKIAPDSTQSNKVVNLQKYIQMLISNGNSSLSPKLTVSGDCVKMQVTDGSVLIVSEDHFHGFSRDYNDKITFCKICSVAIDDVITHKMTTEHMKRVMTPIQDVNGIREGLNRQSYCVLCNNNLVTKEGHIKSDTHINTLGKALTDGAVRKINQFENSTANTPNQLQTYCKPCNKYIDSHNFDGHTKGAAHMKKIKLIESNNNTQADNVEPKQNTPNQTYCAPCSIYIDINNADCHFKGKRHIKNTGLTENVSPENSRIAINSSTFSENEAYCIVCKLYVSKVEFPVHIISVIHKKNVQDSFDPISITQMRDAPQNCFVCRVCEVNVVKYDHNVQEHIKGGNHTKNYTSLLNSNKITKYDDSYYNCEVCRSLVAVISVLDHIDSFKHKSQRLKPQRLCNICNVSIVDHPNTVNDHKNGARHKKKLAELYTHYDLELNNDNVVDVTYKCNVCDVYIDSSQPKSHIDSVAHYLKLNSLLVNNKIQKNEGLLFCSICSHSIEYYEVVEHVSTEKHKSFLTKMHYCNLCSVRIPNTTKCITIHEEGRNHVLNLSRSQSALAKLKERINDVNL